MKQLSPNVKNIGCYDVIISIVNPFRLTLKNINVERKKALKILLFLLVYKIYPFILLLKSRINMITISKQ